MTERRERASPEAVAEVRRIMSGVRLSQAVSVLVRLGVPAVLADGRRPADEIASVVHADPVALHRLLRTLAAAGVLVEHDDGAFSLSPVGHALRDDVEGSAGPQATLFGRPYVLEAWANLEHSIRTGENAFKARFGEDVWEWRARQPDEESMFNEAMASITAVVGPAVAAAYDFSDANVVADIGGGSGTLLAAVVAAHPHLRGILFDQPAVVAEAAPILEAAGVAASVSTVGGSFFDAVPPADVYLIKAILHDWPDEEAAAILRVIRAAGSHDGRLLVIELVLGGPNEDLAGKLSDLNMLVMPGGRERTLEEWRSLLASGGWRLARVTPLQGAAGVQLIEAEPG